MTILTPKVTETCAVKDFLEYLTVHFSITWSVATSATWAATHLPYEVTPTSPSQAAHNSFLLLTTSSDVLE